VLSWSEIYIDNGLIYKCWVYIKHLNYNPFISVFYSKLFWDWTWLPFSM